MWNVQHPAYVIYQCPHSVCNPDCSPLLSSVPEERKESLLFWGHTPYLAPAFKGMIQAMFDSKILGLLELEGT